MVTLKKIEHTDKLVRYEIYPEGRGEAGVISFDLSTGKAMVEKAPNGYLSNYFRHAISKISEYWKQGTFPDEGMSAWY